MIERALKLAREYSGISPSDMAKRLDVSRSFIADLESGKKRVHVEVLQKYANVLKLPASAFLDFADALSGEADPERQKRAEKLVHVLNWVMHDEQSEDKTVTSGEHSKADEL